MLGVVSVLVVLAGCATDQTTEVAGVSITSSTSTTTPRPIPIDEFTQLAWEQGIPYTADAFLVPVSFVANRSGWLSRGGGSRWVSLWFDENLDGDADATLTLLAHRPTLEPDVLVSEILQIEGIRQLTPAMETTVGERQMIVVDVEGEHDRHDSGQSECSVFASARLSGDAGYELFQDGGSFGVPACFVSRLWIVEVGGNALTFVGVVEDEDRFDDLVLWLEQLLASGVSFAEE